MVIVLTPVVCISLSVISTSSPRISMAYLNVRKVQNVTLCPKNDKSQSFRERRELSHSFVRALCSQCSGNVGVLESQKHLVLIDDKKFIFKTSFLTVQNNNRKLSQQQKQNFRNNFNLFLGIMETEKTSKITCQITLFINWQRHVINWHLLNNWSMIFFTQHFYHIDLSKITIVPMALF